MSWSQTPYPVYTLIRDALVAAGYHEALMPEVGQDVATLLDKSVAIKMRLTLASNTSDDGSGNKQSVMSVEILIEHVWYKEACATFEAIAELWSRESAIRAALAVPAVGRANSHTGLNHTDSLAPRSIAGGKVSQVMIFKTTITRGSA